MATVRVRQGEKLQSAETYLDNSLVINPANWSNERQLSCLPGDPLNRKLAAVKKKAKRIYQKQEDAGFVPSAKSISLELITGETPELIKGKWGYSQPTYDPKSAYKLMKELTPQSSLALAYQAYTAYLHTKKNTAGGLSDITLGRWARGLKLLNAFADATEVPLPVVSKISLGWAKRFHTWLQTQIGGPKCLKPISISQATRFVLKISNVLDWMIEEDLITTNPISRIGWPKSPDKEVLFLEAEHVHHLLTLDLKGTKGITYWWFLLMCCTGMDYLDAIDYAKNRKAFEVLGPAGWKIVGHRHKPPHSEYHLPLLNEVNALFNMWPNGPIRLTSNCLNQYTHQIQKDLGIPWRITIKTARKTFGSLMLAAGHRIADVSLMLGHRSISTTEKYYVKVRGTSIDRSMERVQVNISELAANQVSKLPPM
ncbi:hypothetical protein GCM10028774_24920 [Spirosoma jeollabukense]